MHKGSIVLTSNDWCRNLIQVGRLVEVHVGFGFSHEISGCTHGYDH